MSSASHSGTAGVAQPVNGKVTEWVDCGKRQDGVCAAGEREG
ncbi:hypothetical protein [Kamptonema formosum]|nr:hypothetical protein [Oscillatoria sp. PCC 10802]